MMLLALLLPLLLRCWVVEEAHRVLSRAVSCSPLPLLRLPCQLEVSTARTRTWRRGR